MYVDPVSTDITRSIAETPPQSASVLARIFRTMAEEYERIARDYENSRNHRIEIDHWQRRDVLVAVEIEKGHSMADAVANLSDHIPTEDIQYLYKWMKPQVERMRREARNQLIIRLLG